MLVLASTSPRRKEILSRYFDKFECVKPQINEEDFRCKDVSHYALELSKMKAYSVFKDHPNDIIISCDTIVVFNDEIFEKPTSREDAKKMIQKLSGNRHFVLSAYTILYKDSFEINQTVKTYVYFNDLSDEQIEGWLNKNSFMDKAGAYAIQGKAAKYIRSINGDYYTIVGLPIGKVIKSLKKLKALS